MARNTLSSKGPKKPGGNPGGNPGGKGRKLGDKEMKAAAGNNRFLILALAGFTVLVIVIIALLAVLNTVGNDREAANFTPNDSGLIPVGETAPDFSAENVNGGGNINLNGDQDATMIAFFASWCPHCQNEAPIISELESQYDGLEVIMGGVDGSQGDDPEAVQRFVENFDIESPAFYNPEIGSEYNVQGYPTVYVLNGENEVVGAHSGEAPRAVYEGWIEEALG